MEHQSLRGFEFLHTTGTVYNVGKSRETTIDNHQNALTVVKNQILLREDTGTSHRFQWTDQQMRCAVNQVLTIIAVVKPNVSRLRFLAVVNHTTHQVFYQEKTIKKLSTPSSFFYLMIQFLACVLFSQTYRDWEPLAIGLLSLLALHFCWLQFRNKTHIKTILKHLIKEIL